MRFFVIALPIVAVVVHAVRSVIPKVVSRRGRCNGWFGILADSWGRWAIATTGFRSRVVMEGPGPRSTPVASECAMRDEGTVTTSVRILSNHVVVLDGFMRVGQLWNVRVHIISIFLCHSRFDDEWFWAQGGSTITAMGILLGELPAILVASYWGWH